MRPDHCTFAKRSSSKILRRVTSEIAFMSANIALLHQTPPESDDSVSPHRPAARVGENYHFVVSGISHPAA
jgi:hypothetical protein